MPRQSGFDWQYRENEMSNWYVVKMSHAKNPDISGGYWNGKPSERTLKVAVATIDDAATACRAYIERNGLGAGNWTGGQVTDLRTKKPIGRIAYNGRYFSI